MANTRKGENYRQKGTKKDNDIDGSGDEEQVEEDEKEYVKKEALVCPSKPSSGVCRGFVSDIQV